MYMHSFQGGATLLSLGLIFILYTMFVWWRDVLRESTLEGHHTKIVQLGPRYGFILFIVSEVMFFFAFFWASFHSSLAPTVEIGGKGTLWPCRFSRRVTRARLNSTRLCDFPRPTKCNTAF
ncbi:unnamed protein product [Linum tenue]|uniref:Cytochrome c oxidase subunit 3 n=1 Tax=Linum tenue TaxID=586396 RepID=A0AAV0S0Q2_9ROSI|nr:unnamed protein product [Linum tenue]